MADSQQDSEEAVKLRTLVDNTAQGIFNYLDDVKNKREIYQKRWVWELLQNALDAAPQGRKIYISIEMNGTKLVFAHNGRPFRAEEVAHLIYHGSTKKESDVGKFGTGFLVTHLISRVVHVKGARDDGKKFDFLLDRSGASADDIKSHAEQAWTDYQKSLAQTNFTPSLTAQYEYSLDQVSAQTSREGIDILSKLAPYVLAFNDRIGRISISVGTSIDFSLAEERDSGPMIVKVIREEREGNEVKLHELKVARKEDVEVALKVHLGKGRSRIDLLDEVPRIFIGFPLFGSYDLTYPVVVNSRKFEPTEKREGIFLGKEDTDHINRNKKLMQTSGELATSLLTGLATECENVHDVLDMKLPSERDWLTDTAWYKELLRTLIDDICNLKAIEAPNGEMLSVNEALVPYIEGSKEELERLWELFAYFPAFKNKMPKKELSSTWAKILTNWESLDFDFSSKKVTLQYLTREVEDSKTIGNLRSKLSESSEEIEFLNELYTFLIDEGQQFLFDQRSILLAQDGSLAKRTALLRDGRIDERLKDISERLGRDLRRQLMDSRVSTMLQNLLTAKTETEVLDDMLALVKEFRPKNSGYLDANRDLLQWLMEHNQFNRLDGFPLLSGNDDSPVVLRTDAEEKPLAPKDVWDTRSRSYFELFPSEFMVSSMYCQAIPDKSEWDKLRNAGFLLTDVSYSEEEKLPQEEMQLLLFSGETLDEQKPHEITCLTLSRLAFLEKKDKGIIDTARSSKEKARKFLNFLFDYLVQADNRWESLVEAACECGAKHRLYPSLWLATLRDRQWVPIRKGKGEKPSASFLAPLVSEDPELLQKCNQDKPSKLLNALGVSVGELMMNIAAVDEGMKLQLDKAMGSLYSTFMKDPGQLTKVAHLAESDPQLFISEIEERLKIREQIRRNQTIGSLVEDVLKKTLQTEGFLVETTGVGSDFSVENDFIKDDKEVFVEIKREGKGAIYVEVKSTVQDSVKMTVTQARAARDKPDIHVLAVVRLDGPEISEDKVRASTRFVTDIGHRVKDKVSKVENFQIEQEAVTAVGDIEIEITEGPVRFKIHKAVWEAGKTFDGFLNLLRSQFAA